MPTIANPTTTTAIYGPVDSWRFGRSLGIDPIGSVSTCSFNCVYCQLGVIQVPSGDRQIFVPTEQIRQELASLPPCPIDTLTLSGSGEPTLALNLGEILTMATEIIPKPIGVLTNGSLLTDPTVRQELEIADWVAVKLDAIDADSFRRVNRPLPTLDLQELWMGLCQFREQYSGHLAIQTMVLKTWSDLDRVEYLNRMRILRPDEIQLNTPTRAQPLTHQLASRGNDLPSTYAYPTRQLNRVNPEELELFADLLESELNLTVRYPLFKSDIEN